MSSGDAYSAETLPNRRATGCRRTARGCGAGSGRAEDVVVMPAGACAPTLSRLRNASALVDSIGAFIEKVSRFALLGWRLMADRLRRHTGALKGGWI